MTYHPKTPVEGIVRITVILILLGWAVTQLHAQEVKPRPPEAPKSIVLVGGCTGVCVHPDGVFLTVKHCQHGRNPVVTFPDGKKVQTTKVYETASNDGPVVLIADQKGDYPYSPVAEKQVQASIDPVFAWGWPSSGDESFYSGYLKESTALNGFRVNKATLVPTPGVSGGPLFSQNGEVIGLCDAIDTDFSFSYWIPLETIKRECSQWMKLPYPAINRDGNDAEAKPAEDVLIVYSADWCGYCKQVERDYQSGHIKTPIKMIKDESLHPEWVRQLPSFEYRGHRWFGYWGHDDLNARTKKLGAHPAPEIPEEHGMVGGGSSPSIGGGCLPNPFRRQRQPNPQVEILPPDNDVAGDVRIDEALKAIASLQDSNKSLIEKLGTLASVPGEIAAVKDDISGAKAGFDELKEQYRARRAEGQNPFMIAVLFAVGILKRIGLNHKPDEPGAA